MSGSSCGDETYFSRQTSGFLRCFFFETPARVKLCFSCEAAATRMGSKQWEVIPHTQREVTTKDSIGVAGVLMLSLVNGFPQCCLFAYLPQPLLTRQEVRSYFPIILSVGLCFSWGKHHLFLGVKTVLLKAILEWLSGRFLGRCQNFACHVKSHYSRFSAKTFAASLWSSEISSKL